MRAWAVSFCSPFCTGFRKMLESLGKTGSLPAARSALGVPANCGSARGSQTPQNQRSQHLRQLGSIIIYLGFLGKNASALGASALAKT